MRYFVHMGKERKSTHIVNSVLNLCHAKISGTSFIILPLVNHQWLQQLFETDLTSHAVTRFTRTCFTITEHLYRFTVYKFKSIKMFTTKKRPRKSLINMVILKLTFWTCLMPIFHFYTDHKNKTSGFLTFSGGVEMEHLP